jgi:hypothetical protein
MEPGELNELTKVSAKGKAHQNLPHSRTVFNSLLSRAIDFDAPQACPPALPSRVRPGSPERIQDTPRFSCIFHTQSTNPYFLFYEEPYALSPRISLCTVACGSLSMRRYVGLLVFALLVAGRLPAQTFTTSTCESDQGGAGSSWFGGHSDRACEVRRATLPLVNGRVDITGENGGIDVVGEERQDIALEAKVTTQDSSREEAQALAREVKIITNGTIYAEGPKSWGFSHRSWAVSWRLRVPRQMAGDLRTTNGGIHLTNLVGAIHADTTNGGLILDDLGGDVHATTVNGGLSVRLHGNEWHGAGLIASATNGGVTVKMPDQYSAHLIAATVNGGISIGFPVTIQGKIQNRIDTTLGHGGALLHIETVNGGVSIQASNKSDS